MLYLYVSNKFWEDRARELKTRDAVGRDKLLLQLSAKSKINILIVQRLQIDFVPNSVRATNSVDINVRSRRCSAECM